MSKIYIVYGPPASGKLTLSKYLSEIYGWRLLHNHLTFDEVQNETECLFYDFEFLSKNAQKRMRILLKWFPSGEDIIFTFCYEPNFDNPFVEQLKLICTEYGYEIVPIVLCVKQDILLERVDSLNRRLYGKIQCPIELKQSLGQFQYQSPVLLDIPAIRFDNSYCNPIEAGDTLKLLLSEKKGTP